MDAFMQAAVQEARKGLAEGGIPIGSVLVIDGEIAGGGTIDVCSSPAPFSTPKWTL